jgi:hypothetical protein
MARSLILTARRLADVLSRENAALKQMDLRLATSLLPEKTAATADLMALSDKLVGHPHPALAAIARSLDDLALENRQLLQRALAAQRRVIGIIARAAVAAEPSYGAKKRLTGPVALFTRA